jgi:integrase
VPAAFHFHDLRPSGNALAADSGASTRELMHRMGHASIPAALLICGVVRPFRLVAADALATARARW